MPDRDRAPLALTMSGSTPHASTQASDCTANASLSSTAPMSDHSTPARRNAFSAASTGAYPNICGSRAAAAAAGDPGHRQSTDPRRRRPEPSTTADAPSFSGEALPAVMVPSTRNEGVNVASFSTEVPGRIDSSRVTSAPGTATVRSS